MPAASGTLHDFLADVTPLAEAQSVPQSCFVGNGIFAQFLAVVRNSCFNSQCLERSRPAREHAVGRRLAAGGAPDRRQPFRPRPDFVPFLARSARAHHLRREAGVVGGEMVVLLHRGKWDVKGFFKQRARAWSLKSESVDVERLEFHLVGDHVTLQALERLVAQVGIGIGEEPILRAVQAHVRTNVPLRGQQRGVSPLARLEPLDVVRNHAVEKLGVVAALHGELAAKGEIKQPGSFPHRLVLRHSIGEMRGNEGAVIFAQRGALRAVVISERGGERRCVHWFRSLQAHNLKFEI